MTRIDTLVEEKLKAWPDGRRAVALWKKVWKAYERGGPDGAVEFLEGLIEWPPDEDVDVDEDED